MAKTRMGYHPDEHPDEPCPEPPCPPDVCPPDGGECCPDYRSAAVHLLQALACALGCQCVVHDPLCPPCPPPDWGYGKKAPTAK